MLSSYVIAHKYILSYSTEIKSFALFFSVVDEILFIFMALYLPLDVPCAVVSQLSFRI
jgi:hypothetical protein